MSPIKQYNSNAIVSKCSEIENKKTIQEYHLFHDYNAFCCVHSSKSAVFRYTQG